MEKTRRIHRFKKKVLGCKRQLRSTIQSGGANVPGIFFDDAFLFLKSLEEALAVLKKREVPYTGALPDFYLRMRDRLAAIEEFSFERATDQAIELLEEIQNERILSCCELDLFESFLKVYFVSHLFEKESILTVQRVTYASHGLYWVREIDFSRVFLASCAIDKIFAGVPQARYADLSERSRAQYRHAVAMHAKKNKTTECSQAKRIAEMADAAAAPEQRQIGYYLTPEHGARGDMLLGYFLAPLALCAAVSFFLPYPLFAALFYLPLWELTRPVLDFFYTRCAPPEVLHEFDASAGAVAEKKVLVVKTDLLSASTDPREVLQKLGQMQYADLHPNIRYCLLADFAASKEEPGAAMQQKARELCVLVQQLNREHGDRFYFAVRRSVFDPQEKLYSGKERKRGAIEDLVGKIRRGTEPFAFFAGDEEFLHQADYLLTLDKDTKMMIDLPTDLLRVAVHPLNQAQVEQGELAAGYGVFTPRVEVDLRSAGRSAFSRLTSGGGGISFYHRSGADFYHSLFGQGIFAGKGLLDIRAFDGVLCGLFPQGRVLSHDILEGSFLRTCPVTSAVATDETPRDLTGWLKRQHRWIRGDWQNLVYLFARIKTADGRRRNPLPAVCRFQLFDNLRRSLIEPCAVLLSILCLFVSRTNAIALLCAALLSLLFAHLFSFVLSFCRAPRAFGRDFFSNTLSSGLLLLAQAAYRLVSAPVVAWNACDAIVRTLYRMCVSKRKLLQWQTAHQVESSAVSKLYTFARLLPSLVVSTALLFFAPYAFVRVAGLAFLCMIPAFFWMKREGGRQRSLSEKERRQALVYARASWQFFQRHLTEENHYLPIDNEQFSPVKRVARRTSPTNIGLAMTSVVSAAAFGLVSQEQAVSLLALMTDTIERLEKYRGNLYNWYSTATLAVMEPGELSSVDSGNFLCCLVCVRQSLLSYDSAPSRALARRIGELIGQTDMGLFYNRAKNLFAVSYRPDQEKQSSSYYDLLMSESRLTGFFTVAMRQAPVEHWYRLGRMLAKSGSYTGCISWTGTMFEYFMPELFLPCEPGSLTDESLRFCLHCQKKAAGNEPYGISESGYFAFDSEMNYQYKAHGTQTLALRPNMRKERVVSPYSTFLTLPLDRAAGMKNLRRLETMRMLGPYGFYEAIDFTPERVLSSGGKIVRSHMAHHVGMSLCALANLVFDGLLQKRFFEDPYMKSARLLLEERPMTDAPVYDRAERLMPRQKEKKQAGPLTENYEHIAPQYPRTVALSNLEFSSVLTDSGSGFLLFGGSDVTRRPVNLLREPHGFYAFVRSPVTFAGITQAPLYDKEAHYGAEFADRFVRYHMKKGHLRASMKVSVLNAPDCEIRQITVQNLSVKLGEIELLFCCQPVLTSYETDAAHRQFSSLFVISQYDDKNKIVVFSRKRQGGGSDLYYAVGLLENLDFSFACDPLKLFERPLDAFDPENYRFDTFDNPPYYVGGMLGIRVCMNLPKGAKKQVHVLQSVALSRQQAVENILLLRKMGRIPQEKIARSQFMQESLESRLCFSLLPKILFGKNDGQLLLRARRENELPRTTFWQFGISGDLPVVVVSVANATDAQRLEYYFFVHRALRRYGIFFDLAILYYEKDGYYQQALEAVLEAADQAGILHARGLRGGFHPINASLCNDKVLTFLKAGACHFAAESMFKMNLPQKPYTPIRVHSVRPWEPQGLQQVAPTALGDFARGCFVVKGRPQRPYTHVLANKTFGCVLSDRALGFSFAFNAAMNKLTPWRGDLAADNTGERLVLRHDGKYYDLVSGSCAIFSPEKAVYRAKAGQLLVETTVSVPSKGARKEISVRLTNPGTEEIKCTLAYYTEPVLGEKNTASRQVKGSFEGGALFLRNPCDGVIPCVMGLASTFRAPRPVCDMLAFHTGQWEKKIALPGYTPCAAICGDLTLGGGEKQSVRFVLSCGRTKQAAMELIRLPLPHRSQAQNSIAAHTPEGYLNHYINTWLPWQAYGARYLARAGYYQVSGAFGFRDQLQDSLGFLLFTPEETRRHILRACAHQFYEGDVLHWWHPLPKAAGGERGVRTRYSDDLLWLPYAVSEYIEKTGDKGLLEILVPYTEGPVLHDGQMEEYMPVTQSDRRESVFMHCIRAIDHGMRLSERGLVLIGGGDWNDGFNAIGRKGRGESVFVTEFLALVLRRFAPLCDDQRRERYNKAHEALRSAVNRHCWDGAWYTRATFDDGEVLGSSQNGQCTIDSLSQSFAVLADVGEPERLNRALSSALEELVDYKNGIIRLFAPSFDDPDPDPGYISAYPAGIRENGGQYTHAAVWLCLALFKQGRVEEAFELVQMLCPAFRCAQPEAARTFGLEPYYMAADIYTAQGSYGKGGWSIYTGAAGWYYQTLVQWLLGLKINGDRLRVVPLFPARWNEADIEIRLRGTLLRVKIRRTGAYGMTVNGQSVQEVLLDGGEKEVEVSI